MAFASDCRNSGGGLRRQSFQSKRQVRENFHHKLLAIFRSGGNDHIMSAAGKFRSQRVAVAGA
jgi:hypothetical protein